MDEGLEVTYLALKGSHQPLELLRTRMCRRELLLHLQGPMLGRLGLQKQWGFSHSACFGFLAAAFVPTQA